MDLISLQLHHIQIQTQIVVKFDMTGITTSPIGIAKTTQSNYATITKFSDYPSFRTTQASAQFKAGERLAVKTGNNFVI